MAPRNTATPATSPTPAGGLDFARLVSHTELAEGGGGFGPTSFKGTIIDAGYQPHRFMSDPPKPDQNPSYFLALWVKFQVHEVLDQESGFDPDEHDGVYDHYWKLGGKSLQYLFATNDTRTPAGISGGFEELSLMAAGKTDGGGIVTFTDPIEQTRGRWFMVQPGIPDSKGKLEGKSGYAVFLRESVPAIEATDPSLVVSWEGKKGEVEKLPNVLGKGPDGYPMGAQFFIGLSGIWDTKKIALDIKGEKAEQRVLYLTSFDGRVEVGEQGEVQTPEQVHAGAPAPGAKKSSAAKKATPPAQAQEAQDTDEGEESLEEKIDRLILASLPITGSVQQQPLFLAVVRDSKAFTQAETPAAAKAALERIKAAPDKAGAADLAAVGMPPLYTYDAKGQTVERWQA